MGASQKRRRGKESAKRKQNSILPPRNKRRVFRKPLILRLLSYLLFSLSLEKGIFELKQEQSEL